MRRTTGFSAAFCLALTAFVIAAKELPIEPNAPPVLALDGNCPVSLVETGKSIRGMEMLSVTYKGFTYRFKDFDTKKRFDAAPDKFSIQLSGYCATCLTQNMYKRGDPKNYAVYMGRIYIFPNEKTRTAFVADPEKYIKLTDKILAGP